MICEKSIKRFCKDDISLIENYDKAIADKTKTWDCHHRRETIFSKSDLIEINEYYDRPACELIFLAHSEHMSLHMKMRMKGKPSNRRGKPLSNETKQKLRNKLLGRHLSEETKKKISAIKQGNTVSKGLYWYNNGKINTRSKKCPEGFVPGRINL